MRTFFILILPVSFLIANLKLSAQIITVKQNGTGDYTTIQAAINASANGDTVLVYPGTYYENVEFAGKNITLASLNLTTGDEAFIHNTIIDGNQNGSCVKVDFGETDAIIHGFTIQNGTGTIKAPVSSAIGGGIYVGQSESISIYYCTIRNNFATGGAGGIFCNSYSYVYISGSTIINNYGYTAGGGIAIGYEAQCIFDENNPSNIYLNYASRGSDVYKGSSFPLHLPIDTFTVFNPSTYFISSTDIEGFEIHDVTYSIQHQKIIPADTNLYVDPVSGNDTNSGLSPNEALKTIAFANTKIMVDSLEKNTIYLANGIYSDTTNGEKFPLNIRPFINYTGQSRAGTVLDGEYKSMIAMGNNEVSDYSFSKMTFRRGTRIDYDDHFTSRIALIRSYLQNENISFDSMLFTEGHCKEGAGIVNILGSNNTRFTNCEFSHNKGDAALRVPFWDPTDTCRIYNCVFYDNKPDFDNPDYRIGRALSINGDHGVGIVANSLFYDNDWNAFISVFPSDNYLVNCTFAGNNSMDSSVAIWLDESTTTMYNCIQYNEGSYPIYLTKGEKIDTSRTRLNIYHSLIEEGEDAIHLHSSCNDGWCFYHYDETNIEGDPLFYGGEEYPYNLSDDSPCIDAGTLEIPDFIELPDYDLAGNQRVFNGKIDMGAYEWAPTVGKKENRPFETTSKKLLQAGPNPFRTEINIFALFERSTHVEIEVFTNSGLRVKVLAKGKTLPGKSTFRWDGKDDNGNVLASGIYYIIMKVNDEEVDQVKVIKL